MSKKLTGNFLEDSSSYFINQTYPNIYLDKENWDTPTVAHKKPKSSWSLVDWIMTNSNLKGIEKLVSLQIAGFYNPKLGYAYPTYMQIMELTGLSYSSVSRAIKKMKLSGEWIVLSTSQNPRSRHTNNRYYYLSPTSLDTIMTKEEFDKELYKYEETLNKIKTTPTKLDIQNYPQKWKPRLEFSSIKDYEKFIKENITRKDWY